MSTLRNPQVQRTTFGYDAAGRRTILRAANTTRTSTAYDANDRVTTVAHLRANNTVIASCDYFYDNTVNRTRIIEADGTRVTFNYDAAYQLTREQRGGGSAYDVTHVWDPAGNRSVKIDGGTRTTGSYDAANQLQWLQTGASRTTYTFDQAGNQVATIPPAGNRTTHTWDYENMATVVLESATSRLTNIYDGDLKRLQKVHDTGAGASTQRFVYDGEAYLATTNAAGAAQANFTQEPTLYGSLIAGKFKTDLLFYHADALGSILALTDNAAGLAETNRYRAFGEALTALTGTNPFRYVGSPGYYHDGATLGYHIRRRRYLPSLARWLSIDPLGTGARRSGFQYARSSPLLRIDPSGLLCRICPYGFVTSPAEHNRALIADWDRDFRDTLKPHVRGAAWWYKFYTDNLPPPLDLPPLSGPGLMRVLGLGVLRSFVPGCRKGRGA